MKPKNFFRKTPETNRPLFPKRASFTLVEIVIVCALAAILVSFSAVSGTKAVERYSNPHSDWRVEAEARDLVDRIRYAMQRSLMGRRDFKFIVSGIGPTQKIIIQWQGGEEESWKLENIGVIRSSTSGGGSSLNGNAYSNRFQTLTPAASLRVYTMGTKTTPRPTKWRITISAYGFANLVGE